jgi:hypothetical protein
VIVTFLLENPWLVLRWAVVACLRRGGRDIQRQVYPRDTAVDAFDFGHEHFEIERLIL